MIYIILYVYIMNNLPNIIFIADNNHFRIWPGKTYYDLLTYVKNNNNRATAGRPCNGNAIRRSLSSLRARVCA